MSPTRNSALRKQSHSNQSVDFVDLHPPMGDTLQDVLAGLLADPKTLSPKYFYDEKGSRLFEEITAQPEYYPTRTEFQILQDNSLEIAKTTGVGGVWIEPGCGNCEKVGLLLDAVQPRSYVGLDISKDFLGQTTKMLARDRDWLPVTAVCADFSQLGKAHGHIPSGRRIAFYPGSTLGNFTPSQATTFLGSLRSLVGLGGGLLIGVDRHKDSHMLNAAYNDAEGATARFNLNALEHLNRVLSISFDLEKFEHHAFYNTQHHRIEMHLRSTESQVVSLSGHDVKFAKNETLLTEYSYKYTPEKFSQLAGRAGWQVAKMWTDPQGLFSLYYCE